MLWVPKKGVLQVQHNMGLVGTTTLGTAVTTGAVATTKGTPAELIASTSFDAYWVEVIATAYASGGTNSSGCLDILTGAATEEVLIPNLLFGNAPYTTWSNGAKVWHFPLYIPAGSRLAAQAAGDRTSTAFRVGIALYGGDGCPPFRVGSKVTTYGASVPVGTAVTPGASGGTGNWAQITASTSEDHFALFPSMQVDDTTMNDRLQTLEIAIGASSAEELISAPYRYETGTGEEVSGPFTPRVPTFADIPSGTRLSVRMSNSGTNDSGYTAALHGVS